MTKTVLIVDDALTIRTLARFCLLKGNYNVLEAEDGVRGLASALAGKPDLIIADLNMPNMNGMEMIRQLKKHPDCAKIPIFMLTTESSEHLIQEGKRLGVSAWIVKPFAPEKLMAVIKKQIGD